VTGLFDLLASTPDFERSTLAMLVSLVRALEASDWNAASGVVLRVVRELSDGDNRWYVYAFVLFFKKGYGSKEA
jgi:hypothetical protein